MVAGIGLGWFDPTGLGVHDTRHLLDEICLGLFLVVGGGMLREICLQERPLAQYAVNHNFWAL